MHGSFGHPYYNKIERTIFTIPRAHVPHPSFIIVIISVSLALMEPVESVSTPDTRKSIWNDKNHNRALKHQHSGYNS